MIRAFFILAIVAASSLAWAGAPPSDSPFIVVTGPDGVQRVDVIAGSYFFKPNHLAVKVNVPVEVTIRKEPGLTPHEFILSAPEAGMDFKEELSTEPKTLRFTPQKTGKYEFYCGKRLPLSKSHRDKGMKGILEVTD